MWVPIGCIASMPWGYQSELYFRSVQGVSRTHDFEPALPAETRGSVVNGSIARLDVCDDLFVEYDRRVRSDKQGTAPGTGCRPMLILEAVYCMAYRVPVNNWY